MKKLALAATVVGVAIAVSASAQTPYPHTGRDLAASCAICHGTNGKTAGGSIPSVAGREKAYLVQQLRDFRDGKRPATLMHQIAKGLTDEQIDAVAEFWAQSAK